MRKSTQKTEREKDSLVAVGETSAFAGESPRNERVHRESDYETEEQGEPVTVVAGNYPYSTTSERRANYLVDRREASEE